MFLFLFACHPATDSANPAAQISPATDSATPDTQATTIPDDDDGALPAEGIIGPDGDTDTLTFEVDTPSWWSFDLQTGIDRNFDPYLAFFAPDGTPYLVLAQPTRVWFPVAGTWTILLSDRGGGGDEDFTYDLTGTAFTAPGDAEPDDVGGGASVIVNSDDEPYAVFTAWDGDADVDRVTLDVIGDFSSLSIHPQGAPIATTPALRLYDRSERLAASVPANSNLTFPILMPGRWTVELDVGASGWDAGLAVSVQNAAMREFEPNDTLADAPLFVTSGTITGRLDTHDEVDVIAIEQGSADGVSVSCQGASMGSGLTDLTLTWLDAAGTPLSTSEWSGSLDAAVGVALQTSVDAGPAGWYTCFVSFSYPDNDSGD